MNSIYINNKSFSFRWFMGNTTDNCKNACLENCQIVVRRDTQLGIRREQKLEPIVFDEHRENQSVANEQVEIKIKQNSNIFTPPHKKYLNGNNPTSASHISKINFEKLVVVSQMNKSPRHIEDEHIDVPSQVVLLSMSKGLKNTIDQVCEQIWLKYLENGQASKQWKLHKKGFYINYLGQTLSGVLNSNIYYEGLLIEIGDDLVPHEEGILVNEKGVYTGNFTNGKANGQGSFKDIESRSIFKGTWKEGRMISGTIQTSQFKFQGSLFEGQVEGKGKLHFKQNKGFFYQGYFSNGLFNDQKGFLMCDQYTYQGGFIQGRKQGKGKLTQIEFTANKRQKQKQQTLKTYKPAEEYDGVWHNDSFQRDKGYYKSRLNTPVR